jgi:hypothetical protein
MKTKTFSRTTILLFFLSFIGFSQKKAPITKAPPVNVEIQNMVKLIFDAPELVKLYKDPKNLPVRILEYDDINKRNFENFKIYGQNVQIITIDDINKNDITDYIDITKWNEVLNMLDFELLHEKTQTRIKILLLKKQGVLKLGTSEIIKGKK